MVKRISLVNVTRRDASQTRWRHSTTTILWPSAGRAPPTFCRHDPGAHRPRSEPPTAELPVSACGCGPAGPPFRCSSGGAVGARVLPTAHGILEPATQSICCGLRQNSGSARPRPVVGSLYRCRLSRPSNKSLNPTPPLSRPLQGKGRANPGPSLRRYTLEGILEVAEGGPRDGVAG